jgi:hypothetical protein
MKKKITRKLVVSSMTLRNITVPDLDRAAGGLTTTVRTCLPACTDGCTDTCGKFCTQAC